MQPVPQEDIDRIVKFALSEDVGSGDVTTLATVPKSFQGRAFMVAREPLIICGLEIAECVFRAVDSNLQIRQLEKDGTRAAKGTILLEVQGAAGSILTAERVALNFVQRLSGIATLTSLYVDAVRGTDAVVLDTRKTTPGLRLLEKYAVACGDGKNHRIGLYDMVLIKDNHLVAIRDEKPNPIAAAVRRAREQYPNLKVEVEADTLEQLEDALETGADIVLLDNMTPDELRTAVKRTQGRARLEASGGINLQTIRAVAETGVDYISVGALTHSARAMDVALDFQF